MNEARCISRLVVCASLGLAACAQGGDESVDVGVNTEALSACNETVPATRFIDGIPSYAQCDTTEQSAIYSNNGIDTSTTSMGSDWVRTQYSGGYQCTELAHRYLYFKWKVKWIPNGNAGMWCDTQPPANSGITQTMAPVHGDVMVLAPGSCGADATTGHVNVVDTIDAAKMKVTVVEQNGARRGSYNQSCGKCFLHVIANDGMNPGETIAPPPAAGAGAAAGAPATAGTPAQVAGAAAPPTRRPAPAGSAAPPATTPPSMPTTPIDKPAPAAAGSAAPPAPTTPPVTPTTGAAGASAATPINSSTDSSARGSDESSGCSVQGAGSSNSGGGSGVIVIAMIVGLRLRRRRGC